MGKLLFVSVVSNLKGYVSKLIFPTVKEESNGLEITTNDFLLIHQTPFARLFPIDGVGDIIMCYVCNLCYFFIPDFLNSVWFVLSLLMALRW